MQINRIELINFRNHQHLLLEGIGSVLVIAGNNATGKTNIIEALQLLSMQESFRRPKGEELVYNQRAEGEPTAITITLEDNGITNTKQIVFKENTKSFFYNKKERPARELLDLIPAVLFTPDDLQIIKGPPEQRRDMLDSLGGRLSKSFATIRAEYYKALRHKNSLLKQDTVEPDLLDSWNINLAKLGTSLTKHRMGLFEHLLKDTAAAYTRISGGEELTGNYSALWRKPGKTSETVSSMFDDDTAQKEQEDRDFLLMEDSTIASDFYSASSSTPPEFDELYEALSMNCEAELRAGRSLVGPHKDDLCFLINGCDTRRFASQGQQRSLALALKIAEIEILGRVSGKSPLLLLDDVMSELDSARRGYFVDLIGKSSQTVLTTTNLGYFDEEFLKRATIVELPGGQEDMNTGEKGRGISLVESQGFEPRNGIYREEKGQGCSNER